MVNIITNHTCPSCACVIEVVDSEILFNDLPTYSCRIETEIKHLGYRLPACTEFLLMLKSEQQMYLTKLVQSLESQLKHGL